MSGVDDNILRAILAGLSILVLGLLVVVIVMLRSLRNTTARRKTPPPPGVRPAPTPRRAAPAPRQAVVRPAPAPRPPRVPDADGGAEDDDQDLTRMAPSTTFTGGKALPRLAADEERDDDREEGNPNSLSESKAIVQYESSDARADLDEPTGRHELILMSAVGQTDRGVKRRRNEDAYLIDMNLQLYAVADGMGGYAGGDIASRLAVQQIRTVIQNPPPLAAGDGRPRRARELIAAVEHANRTIFQEAQAARELRGMGTTVIAARFSPQKQRVYLAHVGDSRCYRFRDRELRMLTVDHTLARRGVIGPMGSNISRAVGVAPDVKVDLIVDKPMPNDIYLLCSDGLPKMVSDDEISMILLEHRETSQLDRAVDALVQAANASGGRDNITVVLVGIYDVARAAGDGRPKQTEQRVEFGPS